MFDAPLTSQGIREAVKASYTMKEVPLDLVVVSPLIRAIDTAQIIFENKIKTYVSSHIRECVTGSDDLGNPPFHLQKLYPHLDFSHLPTIWWYTGGVEHNTPHGMFMSGPTDIHETIPVYGQNDGEDYMKSRTRFKMKPFVEPEGSYRPRIEAFKRWLVKRREERLAVVGHSDWIRSVLGIHLKNCEIVRCSFDHLTKSFTLEEWNTKKIDSTAEHVDPSPEAELIPNLILYSGDRGIKNLHADII